MRAFLVGLMALLVSCGDPGIETTSQVVDVAEAAPITWAKWTKNPKTFAGPYKLDGDPSVIRDGPILRMVYACFDVYGNPQGPAICQATSTDGLTWRPIAESVSQTPGMLVLDGTWDTAHETPLIIKRNGEYLVYSTGYVDKGGFFASFPGSIGLATSVNGTQFIKYGSQPVLTVTTGGHDNDALFSPVILDEGGRLIMYYAAHCWNNCPRGAGLRILAATSTDGRVWTKRSMPIMDKTAVPGSLGVAEPAIVKGPDGWYYLFTTRVWDSSHDIAISRSTSPFGPFSAPVPIISRGSANAFDGGAGPIAPTVLIENGKARMWYSGFNRQGLIQIGYAEASLPLSR